MGKNEYQLSGAAFDALDEILASKAFATDERSFIFQGVLAYLKSLPFLNYGERALKTELESMSPEQRERLSIIFAASRGA